ncbi:PAS domain-containing protein [Natrialbaceae archaeon A-gly3]
MATSDRAKEELRARVHQQEVVAELSRQALENDDLDALLRDASVAVRETLEADYCKILETLPGGEGLLLREGVGWQEGLAGEATVPTDLGSQAGYTLLSEEPVVVSDLETETRFSGPDLLVDHDVTSGVSVVIGSLEDPWGVLGVHTTDRREFTEDDATFVQNVANLLASAIENERTKRRLRGAQGLTDKIVETSPIGILRLDTDGEIVSANERATEILRRDRETIESMSNDDPDWGFVDDSGEPLPTELVPSKRALRDEERVLGFEMGIEDPAGGYVWISLNAEPLRDEDREVTGVILAFEDVTERKRLEDQLRAERALKDQILKTSPVGITLIDEDGMIVFANDRAEELLGRPLEELRMYVHDDERWDVVDEDGEPMSGEELPFSDVKETGEPVYDEVVGIEHPDGRRVWLSTHCAPLSDEDGEFDGAVYALEDITEEKRLESELETTLNRVTDAFSAFDTDWNFTYANERARELLGAEDRDLSGKNVWEEFPSAVDSRFEEEYKRAMETQEPITFEEYSPAAEAWLEVNLYPSETGLSVYFRDVTERREMEAELRERNRTLQRLYEITADRDRSFDEKVGLLLEVGRDRLGLETGLLAEIDEERNRFEVTHAIGDDDRIRPGVTTPLSDTYCRRTIESDELVALTDAPAEGWSDDHAYQKWDFDCYLGGKVLVDGDLHGTLCFVDESARRTDFTPAERTFVELVTQWLGYELEREKHRLELEESERRSRTLIEHFPNGAVGLFDENLRYTLIGGELIDDLEDSPKEIVGTSIYDRYPDDVIEDLEPKCQDALKGDEHAFEFEYQGMELHVHTLPVRNGDGEVFAGMLMVQDITERKEYQRRIEESNERLEQFAYAASHDLQEPLRMISSYLSLVERRYGDQLDENGQEFIEYAVDGADRMQEMIDGLLAYSRVDTRGDPFEPVDIEELLEDVLADLEMRIAESNAGIEVDPLPTVYGDASQLRQVFQNLLSNAIEYSGEEPPRITVSADRSGGEWILSVEDEGIGIDPEDTDRIFEVFNRLHSIEEHPGTGIGLALCQRIIERHDGRIRVDSEPGEGSTFSFTLPAVPTDD